MNLNQLTQALIARSKPLRKNPLQGLTTRPVNPSLPESAFPVRHFDFGFESDQLDPKFYMQAEWASAYFAALSIFLTYGEDLVIETARYHRELIKDPVLKQRLSALIGQEALHSKMHNQYNDAMIPRNLPVTLYRKLAEVVFDKLLLKFPQPLKLSLMSGIEHFTAVLAEYMMRNEENFYHSDDVRGRGLWMWHMLEESEHKDVAYDVYQQINGSYPLRMAGFAIAAVTLFGGVSAGALVLPFFRRPKNLVDIDFWREALNSFALLFGPKRGVFGSSIKHIADYVRPSFHPNDHDASEYLAYYKQKLLDPEYGALTPYFIKEFTPKLRA